MKRFLAELKRRRVLRAVALYVVGAWVAIQVATTLTPVLELPDWTSRMVVALAAIGLPIVISLSWALDFTRTGIERTADSEPAAFPPAAPGAAGAGWNPGRIAVAGAVAVLALAAGAFVLLPRGDAELASNRVVVDAFQNRTGDASLDAVGAMAADWIVQGAQRIPDAEVIAASAGLGAAADEGEAPAAGRPGRSGTLAREFAARLVVSGSYYLERDTLRLVAEVTDARRNRLLHTTEPIAAERGAPSAGLDTLRLRVATFLAVWLDEAQWGVELTGDQVSRLPTLEAYQQYATGNQLFSQGRYRESLSYLDAAIALDSTFARAIGLAAVAHTNVGDFERARPYVVLLSRQRDRLTHWEVLQLDWHEANHRDDLPGQFAAARRALQAMPGSAEWGYLTALHAIALNRPNEAAERLDAVDPEGGRSWRPFWNVYANAHHLRGDHRSELRVIAQARAQHPDHRSYENNELQALAARGRADEVLARLGGVEAMNDPVNAMLDLALELDAHGNPAASRQVIDRLLAWFAARPARDTLSWNQRNGHALALAAAGRNAEARAILEPLTAVAPDDIHYRGNLGWVAAALGDSATASAAIDWLETARMDRMRGRNLAYQARIAAELGQADRAITLLRAAFAQGHFFGREFHRDFRLRRLRGHPEFDELLRPRG